MPPTVRTISPSLALIILLGALTAFASLSIDMYLPALPIIGHDLGATIGATQATMAVFLGGMAIGQLVYGPLSDRVGRRPLIVFGLGLYLVASLLCALAPSIEIMTAGRLLQALGCSAGVVLASAVVRDVFDSAQTAKVMNGLVMVMGLSPILAPAIGAGVLLFAGWRVIFWVLIAITIVVLARSFFALGESRSAATKALAASEHPLRSYATLLGNPRLLGYLLVGALAGGMLFAYLANSPALLIQVYGFSPQAYSGLVALNSVGIIAGAVVSTTMVGKIGVDHMIAGANGVAVFFALLLFAAASSGIGGHLAVLVLLFLTLSTFGAISANCLAGALSTDPLRSGSISALMNGAPFVAAGVTAWLSGALWDHSARPMGGVMLGCMLAAAAAFWLLVMPASRAVWSNTQGSRARRDFCRRVSRSREIWCDTDQVNGCRHRVPMPTRQD